MQNYILESMATDFDSAISKRHLPGESGHSNNRRDSAAYVKALKVRLKCLGYLGKDNPIDGRVNSVFERAIKRFQKSVGMTVVDGWAGEKTWEMLEFLCSFENKQNPSEWLGTWCDYCNVSIEDIDLAGNEAVLRSVYLRLYAYGAFGYADDSLELNSRTDLNLTTNTAFVSAIETFHDFLKRLYPKPSIPEPELSLPFLTFVFEYDELVSHVSSATDFSNIKQTFPELVDALARIELWLSGYDIAPGSPKSQRYKRKVGPAGKKKTKYFSKMERALSEFYKSLPEPEQPQNQKQVTKTLFYVLSTDAGAHYEHLNEQAFNQRVKKVLANKQSEKQLTKQFSVIANAIWDGAKRLLRSLLRWLKGKFTFIAQVAANLARYISRSARQVYGYVRKAIVIVAKGVDFYSRELLPSSEDNVVAVAQSKDFDQQVIVGASASKNLLQSAYSSRFYESRAYRAATRIFRHLVNVARQIAALFLPGAGWLKAMLSLRKMAASVSEIRQEIDVLELIKGS